jgi:hypothetical protein
MTTAYIRALQSLVDQDQRSHEDMDAAKTAASRDRLTPLEDRLTRLLSTIPENIQQEGLSLPAVQAGLKGRWRGNCHPGELGAALRKLGFVRRRDWQGTSGFRAVWRKSTITSAEKQHG